MYLPVYEPAPPVDKPAPILSSVRGSELILIVDDEEIVRRTLQNSLERVGYRILKASNGQEAIDCLRQVSDRVALALLDMTMPVMAGEEAPSQLREIQPGIRVIASSGYSEAEVLARFGDGVDGFLQKPYTTAQLTNLIRTVLDAPDPMNISQ